MKLPSTRIGSVLAIAAQASFAAALAFLPWKAAALVGFGLSLAAIVLRFIVPGKRSAKSPPPSFPRLELGSLFTFSAMAASSLILGADWLFPLTGVFFACGLGCASITETVYAAIDGRSTKPFVSPGFFLGNAYLASGILQLAFFPRPAYLSWGLGLLIAASLADIICGIASAMAKRRLSAKGAATAVLFLALTLLSSAAVSESPAGDDDALFLELFGEAPPEERPSDAMIVSAISIQRPDCFTDAYVLSFAREIEVGERMTRGELEKALRLVGDRLELSGMFYQSSASYRNAGTEEDGTIRADVSLSVSEGFWWGFNFGPWDLSLGYSNLFREGKRIAAMAGLNSQMLSYSDPAIDGSRAFSAIAAGHSVRSSSGAEDPRYILERALVSGSLGYAVLDDLSFDLELGYLGSRALPSYFLYPDFASPSDEELSPLGIGRAWGSTFSAGAGASAGAFSFKKRGGIKARANAEAIAYYALGTGSPAIKLLASGELRYDAQRLLRLSLLGKLEALPLGYAGGGLPEPLWPSVTGFRGPANFPSGDVGVLSRASLCLDSVATFNLGFTTLSLIPEFFYEIAVSRREARLTGYAVGQDCGALLKFAFSSPVGRTFGIGAAMGLPVAERPSLRFVFEVE